MSSRFGVKTDGSLLPGLVAVGLFVLLAAVALAAPFGDAAGFPGEGSVMASIGYAMFGIEGAGEYGSDNFLVAFEIIDLVLVAALAAAVMLAKREGGAIAGVLELGTNSGRDTDRRRENARADRGERESSRSDRSGRQGQGGWR